jgi:hypothetical protein
MSAPPKYHAGQEIRAPYPFIRTSYEAMPEGPDEVPVEKPTWRPGVEHELTDNTGSTITYADMMGEVYYQVVAIFKPGTFPERIFFVRQWIDPDGRWFGKGKLHITTTQAFRRLCGGYRHDFEMSDYEHNLT